ncbi:hypothetical protein A2Z67_04945 [Candidatus Woesebacteria bacterium RBG_13_36_22]|uniref:Transglycosylase SLT domain-containing protein n=1 Tax=Candidatus Woesebacteria bacterium RBG_13_36_22 TaxID=1802478 RepID=A0A1F7X4G6_9BACT|nr:MAG: hypothetical protein A2Z67_04945 [Candidatus Woesebacteria bacterium RBG_13_36_22]
MIMIRIVYILFLILICFATPDQLLGNDLKRYPKTKKRIVQNLKMSGVENAHELLSDKRIKLYPHIFKKKKIKTNNKPVSFTDDSIERGKQFIAENEKLLDDIEMEYGVPKEIIVSITRTETNFGNYLGELEVVNSILTWVVHNKRRKLFEKELTSWFLICNRNNIDPFEYKGSTCGAFGLVQFLPSSYLRWAVDWDKDGVIDLFSIPDALASCANYLKIHGWDSSKKSAILAYNRSRAYVRYVFAYSKKITVPKRDTQIPILLEEFPQVEQVEQVEEINKVIEILNSNEMT